MGESITKPLEQAGIPLEVIDRVSSADAPNLERLANAVEHCFSRSEDKHILTPLIMLIGRLSEHTITPLIYPNPTEEDINRIALYERSFLESIRQQLALLFAVARQNLTLDCNLVCPFSWKGKALLWIKAET